MTDEKIRELLELWKDLSAELDAALT